MTNNNDNFNKNGDFEKNNVSLKKPKNIYKYKIMMQKL